MAFYAKIENGLVTDVIVADEEFIHRTSDKWIQTSYNTLNGEHLLDGTPLRKNYASIGCVYDSDRDAFYQPQPYPSWSLDEYTCQWIAPVEHPDFDHSAFDSIANINPLYSSVLQYEWNEEAQNWKAQTLRFA